MKTNSTLTTIFVLEKTPKRAQCVNVFLEGGGHKSKVEVVSVTDLFMEGAFSQE
jgi:hypothetical protein